MSLCLAQKGWCSVVNKNLFNTQAARVPAVETKNEAGGTAYNMTSKHALAQYVCTSCLNGTFYTSAKSQLDSVKKLLTECEPEFVGKVAVYGHEDSYMKDLPALCMAYLASDPANKEKLEVLKKTFHRVIDSGNMVRNFVQIVRSGAFGRRSFGEVPRRLVREWFQKRSPASIFHQSIGNNPSIADVIKIVHPSPLDGEGNRSDEKAALMAYLLGAETTDVEGRKVLQRKYLDRKDGQVKVAYSEPWDNLPQIVRDFENWKVDKTLPVPAVNFRFLDNEKLSTEQWTDIARKANWLTTVKSLGTYANHGVFDVQGMTDVIAERVENGELISQARAFPYQIMMAYLATDARVPARVRNALQSAMELATHNVPSLGRVVVCPDVSGSMRSPVTGDRGSATTKVRCVDVAALVAATILRTNKEAEVIPFEQSVVDRVRLNGFDSIMTNAEKLASVGGGGTNCSAPMQLLNTRRQKADVVVYISDYESWVDSAYGYGYNRGTGLMHEWTRFKDHNPGAKLVCIDLTPRTNTQVKEHEDILQVGGFSDAVFDVVARFVKGGWNKNFWVETIQNVPLG